MTGAINESKSGKDSASSISKLLNSLEDMTDEEAEALLKDEH